MMTPKKLDVNLPDNLYNLLVNYYNNAYELEFVTIARSIERRYTCPIIFWPIINQFERIHICAEIFGSANTPRFYKNSFIFAKFIQENNMTDLFSGQVQYYFEHEVNLPSGKQTHYLAFVKWYMPAPNYQKRFYCHVDNDINTCNIKLWENKSYDISRDSVIPIHNIYSRFIPSKFVVGQNSITYLAVIPIGRHFHI